MKRKRRKKVNYEIIIKRRFLGFFIGIVILFSIVLWKLGEVMLVKEKDYQKDLAILTHAKVYGTSSPRGRIYDRNYNILVDNKSLKTITYQKKKGVSALEMIEVARKIAPHLDLDYQRLTTRSKKEYFFALNREYCDSLVTEKEKEVMTV